MSTSSAIIAALSPTVTDKTGRNRKSISGLFRNQTFYFFVYVALCFITVVWHCGWQPAGATSFLWALACTSVGAAFGFLFGIPKILQGNQAADDKVSTDSVAYRQQVNTNLTEISDWLTKIIVGLGLINLGRIPGYLSSIAQTLAESIEGGSAQSHKAFAYGLIVCFPVLGFLAAYLYTRLFLQGAFSRADQEAAQQRQNETDARVSSLETKVDTQQDMLIETKMAPLTVGTARREVVSDREEDGAHKLPGIPGLRKIAEEYLNVASRDYHARLRIKNELGKKMFNYVLRNDISKEELVKEVERSGNEAIALPLAHYMLASPELGDVSRILRIGFCIRRWHVQYRIVQALGQLFEKHCATSADRDAALRLLVQYDLEADVALKRLIHGTRSLIERNLEVEESVRL